MPFNNQFVILLTFVDFVKVNLIDMFTVNCFPQIGYFMKMAIFRNKGYDLINFVHDVPTKFYHLNQVK